MSECSLMRRAGRAGLALATAALPLLGAGPAWALQPLDEFVSAARSANLDNREAQATAQQRTEEGRQAWTKLAPTATAKATYTHNQFLSTATVPTGQVVKGQPVLETLTFAPIDQLDAVFALNVPIVDVGSWIRIGAGGVTADAARARAQGTGLDVEKAVVQGYYQVVAAEATLAAAEKALATARESQAIVATRREAGTASDLDTERARADVERQRQIVASAEQARAVARRALESLTGVTPSEGTTPLPEDGLAEEPALAALEPSVRDLPSVRAAALDARAADKTADAAWTALAPTIAGNATEHVTNAPGFGHVGTWSIAVAATWNVDVSTVYAAKALGAARAAADVREKRAMVNARDALHTDWQAVRADVARARAAKAEAEASERAAELAHERYKAGAATQLDVQQADRDAFQGEVAYIQTLADLAYARAAVRLDSGRPRGAPGPSAPPPPPPPPEGGR
jgi:outer membrane protein TolC